MNEKKKSGWDKNVLAACFGKMDADDGIWTHTSIRSQEPQSIYNYMYLSICDESLNFPNSFEGYCLKIEQINSKPY